MWSVRLLMKNSGSNNSQTVLTNTSGFSDWFTPGEQQIKQFQDVGHRHVNYVTANSYQCLLHAQSRNEVQKALTESKQLIG